MATIEVQKIPRRKSSPLELLAELCYYYQQYTFAQARKLPAKHVVLLLKTARRKEAANYFNLVQIAAAPHTKNGSGVQKLSGVYKGQAQE